MTLVRNVSVVHYGVPKVNYATILLHHFILGETSIIHA